MPAHAHHRQTRLRLLEQLIRRQPVRSQAELVRMLRKHGHAATQSTLSRDLSRLGAAKVDGAYALPEAEPETQVPGAAVSVTELVVSCEAAGANMLVVRTTIGAAAVVAFTIDSHRSAEVVGTIAGDDTVFVATRGPISNRRIAHWLDTSLSSGASS